MNRLTWSPPAEMPKVKRTVTPVGPGDLVDDVDDAVAEELGDARSLTDPLVKLRFVDDRTTKRRIDSLMNR